MRDYFVIDMVWLRDYYPFGALMPGRSGGTSDTRYGFNGMEKDDELKGEGNSYDFGARIYDPRLGRFLSLDPKSSHYPDLSPYCFAANSPIVLIDEEGEGPVYVVQSKSQSEKLKPLIESYSNGDISYSVLDKAIKETLGMDYTKGKDADYLKRQYAASNLNLRYKKDRFIDDDSWYSNFSEPAPYVAYKEKHTLNAITTIILTEQGDDGKWVQNSYDVVDPERQKDLETFLPAERVLLQMENSSLKSQLRELRKKLKHEEAVKTAAEIMQENDSKGGSDWGPKFSNELMRKGAENEIEKLTKQIEQTKNKLADNQDRLNTNQRETNLNNSLKGKRVRERVKVKF